MSAQLLAQDIKFTCIQNQPLSQWTTFACGGLSRGIIVCQTADQVCDIVVVCQKRQLPFIVIGGGSNIVVSDQGLDCYVIVFASQQPLIECQDTTLRVCASSNLDDVVYFAAQQGLSGLNYASGVPGTIGGAIVGNAGAFGEQLGDVIVSVEIITSSGQHKVLSLEDCAFSYRDSIFKHNDDIILFVTFQLEKSDKHVLFAQRDDILKSRHEKHPDWKTVPCAGSFFRNIDATSASKGKRQAAGWFLEQAGAKALRCGNARVFEHHANIIVADGKPRAQDVYDLAQKMQVCVKFKFDFELIREVRFIGDFNGVSMNPRNKFF